MSSASQQYVNDLARKAAAQQLARAATFAELHTAKPLFQRTMKQRGGAAVLVRLDWPGVLRVFDPATGELLAESDVGNPGQLAERFKSLSRETGGAT